MAEAKRRKYPKQPPRGIVGEPWGLGAVLMFNGSTDYTVMPFPHEQPRIPDHVMRTVIQQCKAACKTEYTTTALLEFSLLGFLTAIRAKDTREQVAIGLMMVSKVSEYRYWFIVTESSIETASIIFIPVTASSFIEAEANIKTAMSMILDAPRDALLRDIPGTVIATLSGTLEDDHVPMSHSLH